MEQIGIHFLDKVFNETYNDNNNNYNNDYDNNNNNDYDDYPLLHKILYPRLSLGEFIECAKEDGSHLVADVKQ